jgi:hypothetical protein
MVKADGNPVRTRKVLAVLVKVYGLLFLISTICTVVSLLSVNDLLANATHVNGQVIGLNYGSKGRRAPVVRFETANGEKLELKSDFYTSPAPNVGDTVKVLYRTSNPRDWRIDDWIYLYFWTLLGAIFMFAWAITLTVVILISRNQARKLDASA